MEEKNKMSLTDILSGVGTLAGGAVGVYAFYKLMKEHYIPWTEELENDKELKAEADKYDCRIDGKEKK